MALELRDVVKRVGAETHIHESSLTLEETGFNILLGTTLAGKTTLMQLMAGLERPTSGEVWFNGKSRWCISSSSTIRISRSSRISLRPFASRACRAPRSTSG
jgi:ABC-type multidrug transport system ATPase subunit